jgi:heme oxygenase (biliverdin-producing, ferredoxin)
MKLHTRAQAPKEGQVPDAVKVVPYVPTHADYLQYLVDSHCVYQALEDLVESHQALTVFRATGLERTIPLQTDIQYLVDTYHLPRPNVGRAGREYAQSLRRILEPPHHQYGGGTEDTGRTSTNFIPQFVCHYYNFYFAHTAGGRMIGKQMSALLLHKKTLAFYQVRRLVV